MAIIEAFWYLLTFKRKPQDIPYSPSLLKQIVVLYALVAGGSLLINYPFHLAVSYTVSDLFVLGGITWLLLRLANKSERFTQTITALIGTQTLLQLMAWPLLLLSAQAEDQTDMLADYGLRALLIWLLVISGHIYRHALEVPLWAGVLMAIGYFFTSMLSMTILFGGR